MGRKNLELALILVPFALRVENKWLQSSHSCQTLDLCWYWLGERNLSFVDAQRRQHRGSGRCKKNEEMMEVMARRKVAHVCARFFTVVPPRVRSTAYIDVSREYLGMEKRFGHHSDTKTWRFSLGSQIATRNQKATQ